MYQSQQPTHKIPAKYPILKYAKKWISCKQFALKYNMKQSLIIQTMGNLHKEGLLVRKPCDCGKGFLYKVQN